MSAWTAQEFGAPTKEMVEYRVARVDGEFVAYVTVKRGDERTVAKMVAALQMESAIAGALSHLGPRGYVSSIGEPKTNDLRAALEAAKRLP